MSPRRSTSAPSTTASITASSATSRPAIADRTAARSASASRSKARRSTECRFQPPPSRRQWHPDQDRRPRQSVDVGEHSYVIRYRTTRQIGRFKDFDELYWNATGNGWIFPIDLAERDSAARAGAVRPARGLYRARRARRRPTPKWSDEKPGRHPLPDHAAARGYEGLTVAVAFPKGVVARAERGRRCRLVRRLRAAAGWPARRCSACSAFYFVAWQRAGRDPRAGRLCRSSRRPTN